MPGADCYIDHVPVMCKFQVMLRKLMKPKAQPKFQLDLLKTNQELKAQFSVDARNRFHGLASFTEAEEIFKEMRDSINAAMEGSIP